MESVGWMEEAREVVLPVVRFLCERTVTEEGMEEAACAWWPREEPLRGEA